MSCIKTFGDLNKSPERGDDNKDQNYYAGGASSGISVIGRDGQSYADKMVSNARPRESGPGDAKFGGSGEGRRLGSTLDPTGSATMKTKQETVVVDIDVYDNGFVLDNGPLREFTKPENKKFVDEVSRGVLPNELRRTQKRNTLFEFNMRKINKAYSPPSEATKKPETFTGQARSLHGSSSSTCSHVTPNHQEVINLDEDLAPFVLDESKPVTSVQVRLSNGKKITFRANLTHTVGDLVDFVMRSQENDLKEFQLYTTFPKKSLSNRQATLEAVGLKNAAVVQQ